MCQDAIFLYGDCEKTHHYATYLGLGTRTLLDIVSPREDSPEIRRMCPQRLGECKRTGIWRWCRKEDRAKRFLQENMLSKGRNESKSARLRRRVSLTNDGFMIAGGCYKLDCNTRTKTTFSDADWSSGRSLPESEVRADLARRVGEMGILTNNYSEELKKINGKYRYIIVRHYENGDLEKYFDKGRFYTDSAFGQSEEGAAAGESSAAGAFRQSIEHPEQRKFLFIQETGKDANFGADSATSSQYGGEAEEDLDEAMQARMKTLGFDDNQQLKSVTPADKGQSVNAQSPEFHIPPLDISSDEDRDGEDEDGESSEDEDSSEEELEELNAQFGG